MDAGKRNTFIVSVGDLLASWNLPHATGRVYGLLLVSETPQSLDAIAAELALSKASVSTAVRQLDSWGLARTIPSPAAAVCWWRPPAGSHPSWRPATPAPEP
ncbi:unnamed protein product [[Actinomadura] parvosata subsp. kistnae]|uniref:GbsR/MarR family transcriptional regulator n=1 Tax=[Actinomadura] parvosata TaxID=1955412 RepID=UPI000D2BAB90|nr:unnamed protein product [Actinomadura parvosata subsp. kistnae]